MAVALCLRAGFGLSLSLVSLRIVVEQQCGGVASLGALRLACEFPSLVNYHSFFVAFVASGGEPSGPSVFLERFRSNGILRFVGSPFGPFSY